MFLTQKMSQKHTKFFTVSPTVGYSFRFTNGGNPNLYPQSYIGSYVKFNRRKFNFYILILIPSQYEQLKKKLFRFFMAGSSILRNRKKQSTIFPEVNAILRISLIFFFFFLSSRVFYFSSLLFKIETRSLVYELTNR